MKEKDLLSKIMESRAKVEQETLSPLACKSEEAWRRNDSCPGESGKQPDFRNPFAHDVDRIIHTHSYARYMDKTQVFFQIKHDHITRRALHVQMVSRIARTIGRCLKLNEDLIEAIAVGHDIGHTPFGHAGEKALSNTLQEKKAGCFVHNAQSVRVLQDLEHKGTGCDLTLQVLDGILGHNGELEQQRLKPGKENLTWAVLNENLTKCLSTPGHDAKVCPSTMEGCVVRVSDMIAYVGKDFEDAVMLNLITRDALPLEIRRVLGSANHEIVNALSSDVIKTSYERDSIAFSDDVYSALTAMKTFNYEHIYNCELIAEQRERFTKMVFDLFEECLSDLQCEKTWQPIFREYLSNFPDSYVRGTPNERIVADYMAGMTDQYFLKQYQRRFMPRQIDFDESRDLNPSSASYQSK